mmetsp:Transcript_8157/g.9404  ORF Transcript_8157/g.9404 Transcript_8157/m.9404 type:complete len:338 (-) Transcript_8157:90-1103(-)
MKLYLSALLSSSMAISSAFQMPSSSFVARKSSIVRMSDEAVAEVEAASKPLPVVQDPMGLYPMNSEERKNGQIQSTKEQTTASNTIYDPLTLYPSNSEERKNGIVKPIEPELKVTKAVVDPMNIYSNDATIDNDAIMSEALPFLTRPIMLTGELAGDAGFDPLGFAKSKADLMNYREAEIKHARLAMLAAAGWPLSEVFDKKIALALHMTPLIDASDRAPSILNGGLDKVNPFYWMACIAAAAAVEFFGINKSKSDEESYFPGNLGFDPLGMYPKEKEGQQRMQLAEIKNGRLAMIAIFGFAIQEFVSKSGVVDETPLFFLPLSESFKIYTNSGYTI